MKLFQRPVAPVQSDATRMVPGDRGLPSIRQTASLQSRISNGLAMGLMLAMGAAVLAGYYFHTAQRQTQARQKGQAASNGRAQSEMTLPALETIPTLPVASHGRAPIALGPAGQDSSGDAVQAAAASVLPPYHAPQNDSTSPRPTSLERRLAGATFTRADLAPEANVASSTRPEVGIVPTPADNAATLPRAASIGATPARVLPTQRLLLPKGAFIDCTLETAIDSSLPGMTTCITATDTFGVDGKVVLLERGTKLVGETRGQVQQGVARIFVLWTEARTPTGVIVPLDSPAADELGRAGLPGTVDRHFWERFGAALFISTIDAAVQAAVQSSNRGTGTLIYNPSATQDVTTEVLKSTLSIAPTVRKDNGDRIQVLVAHDVDFTSVYELRHTSSGG